MATGTLRLTTTRSAATPARGRATVGRWLAVLVLAGAAGGCGVDVNTLLEQLSEARQLTADMLVTFIKAADASNRAVMADTDEASVAFAREAEQALDAQKTGYRGAGAEASRPW